MGYQVALVRTPSYYRPQTTEAALESHFCAVADESPIPVLIYAVPQFTGMPVTAGLVEKLGQHPNILGIKESSGVMQLVADILRRTGPDFQVVVGSATTFYPSLTLGARGGILAVACALPELFVELYEASIRGEHEKARALQQRLHEPTVAVTSRYGVAGLKHAMELRGYAGGEPRLPLLPLDEASKRDVERIFQAVDASN
jgi:4-hydroxy-2-oxoglutarate aldolase